jgi:hypothetical protein
MVTDGNRTINLIEGYVTEIHTWYYRRWGFFGHWVWRVDFNCPDLIMVGWGVIIDDETGEVLRQSPQKGAKIF